MTRISLTASCLIGFLLIISSTNGQNRNNNRNTNNGGRPTVQENVAGVSEKLSEFSLQLLLFSIKQIPNMNVITSPFSVWAMMTVLCEGAAGETQRQMKKHLRIGRDMERTRDAFKHIAKSFLINTTTIELETVNSIYLDIGRSLKDDYRRLVQDSYLTDIRQIDFRDGRSANSINNEVRRITRGRIKAVINEDDLRDSQVVITNAIYFRGQWTMPFNTSMTERVPFYDSFNNVIGEVNMMHQKMSVPFSNIRDFKAYAVKIPYGEVDPNTQQNRLSMYVILPQYNVSLASVLDTFERKRYSDIIKTIDEAAEIYEGEEVDVYLPRFSIDTDITLNRILFNMGIQKVFDPATADLSNLSGDRSLYLSRAIHKAHIEVTEEGTIASAISAGTLANRITPPKFNANKPFLFIIAEATTNIAVFGGSYIKPTLY